LTLHDQGPLAQFQDSIGVVTPEDETHGKGKKARAKPRREIGGIYSQWAGCRERNLASGRGRIFFLTSLFIELIEKMAGQNRGKWLSAEILSSPLDGSFSSKLLIWFGK
jgi:hypothetical protein